MNFEDVLIKPKPSNTQTSSTALCWILRTPPAHP